MKRRRPHSNNYDSEGKNRIIRKKRGKPTEEVYAEQLSVPRNVGDCDWSFEEATGRDSSVRSVITDTFDSISQDVIGCWSRNQNQQILTTGQPRRERSGDSLSEILEDFPFAASEAVNRERSLNQQQEGLRRRFLYETDLLESVDTVIESPDKLHRKLGQQLPPSIRKGIRAPKIEHLPDTFAGEDLDVEFGAMNHLSPSGFSPLRSLRQQRPIQAVIPGTRTQHFLNGLTQQMPPRLEVYDDDFPDGVFDNFDIPVSDYIDDQIVELELSSGGETQYFHGSLNPVSLPRHPQDSVSMVPRHQHVVEEEDDEEFVFADGTIFSPAEFLDDSSTAPVGSAPQNLTPVVGESVLMQTHHLQQQQYQMRNQTLSSGFGNGGRRRKSPLKPMDPHSGFKHQSSNISQLIVQGSVPVLSSAPDLVVEFDNVVTGDDYLTADWHSSGDHGSEDSKDPFDSPLSPSYLSRGGHDTTPGSVKIVNNNGSSPGQSMVYKRSSSFRRPAILRTGGLSTGASSPSSQSNGSRVLSEPIGGNVAMNQQDMIGGQHLSDFIFPTAVCGDSGPTTVLQVATTIAAAPITSLSGLGSSASVLVRQGNAVNSNPPQTRTASANLLQKRQQAARQQHQSLPIITTVSSTGLQENSGMMDEACSNFDMVDFSSSAALPASALYWSDYEPQIKERKEKVITQDMIDQRPRQAIRKYYSALKKHLSRQERKCVSPVPFSYQSSNSANNTTSNTATNNNSCSGGSSNQSQCRTSNAASSGVSSSESQNSCSATAPTGHRPIQNLGYALQELRSRTTLTRDQYKVIVVDDPNGRQEAVLVSNPPNHLAAATAINAANSVSHHAPGGGVNTNTAGLTSAGRAVQSARIKGQSARSLLKEIRVVTLPDGTVRRSNAISSGGGNHHRDHPRPGSTTFGTGQMGGLHRRGINNNNVTTGFSASSVAKEVARSSASASSAGDGSLLSVRRQTQVKLMTYCQNGDTVAMNLCNS